MLVTVGADDGVFEGGFAFPLIFVDRLDFLFTAKLPTYMSYRAYFDCREGDAARLEGACDALLAALAPGL